MRHRTNFPGQSNFAEQNRVGRQWPFGQGRDQCRGNRKIGGLAVFVGLVREMHTRDGLHRERIEAMTLEHYPGMTEKALQDIAYKAKSRWDLGAVHIIHRVGHLKPNAQIVFVGVASAHRAAAFSACEFIMDYLKNQAPFWKKEHTTEADYWVAAKESDKSALSRWEH